MTFARCFKTAFQPYKGIVITTVGLDFFEDCAANVFGEAATGTYLSSAYSQLQCTGMQCKGPTHAADSQTTGRAPNANVFMLLASPIPSYRMKPSYTSVHAWIER